MLDISRYYVRHNDGLTAQDAYLQMKLEGVNLVDRLLVFREVYGMSLEQAYKLNFFLDTGKAEEGFDPRLEQDFIAVLDAEGI